MTYPCTCASGCLYAKEGKRRGHETNPRLTLTKILLDLLRPRNRSVPTGNMTLIDTCLDCFSPVLYLAWISLQKYHIPSSPKCSSVYENACFI